MSTVNRYTEKQASYLAYAQIWNRYCRRTQVEYISFELYIHEQTRFNQMLINRHHKNGRTTPFSIGNIKLRFQKANEKTWKRQTKALVNFLVEEVDAGLLSALDSQNFNRSNLPEKIATQAKFVRNELRVLKRYLAEGIKDLDISDYYENPQKYLNNL